MVHDNKVGEVKELIQDSWKDKVKARSWYKQHKREVKLVACFLGKRWFPLAFFCCGVQGKVKFLLGFGFIVSLLFYFVRIHWYSACASIASSKLVSLIFQWYSDLGDKITNFLIFNFCSHSHHISFVFHAVRPEGKFLHGLCVRLSTWTIKYIDIATLQWWMMEKRCLILANITMFCDRCKN